jgi:hypothetical protein
MYKSKKDKHLDNRLELLLRVVMPDKDLAWQAGFHAAMEDIEIGSNPFHKSDDEYKLWADGWWTGFYGGSDIIEEVLTDSQAQVIMQRITAMREQHSQEFPEFLAQKQEESTLRRARRRYLAYSVAGLLSIIAMYGYWFDLEFLVI